MDNTRYVELLEQHGIRPTSNRIVVAKALAEAEHPASIADLERRILTIDKSGIFRSLMLFRDHHLVHALEDGEGKGREVDPERFFYDTSKAERMLGFKAAYSFADGLTDMARDEEIAAVLADCPPAAAAEELVHLALQHGGTDNVSVLLLEVKA